MKKEIILKIITTIALLNFLLFLFFIFTTPSDYILGTIPPFFFKLIYIIIPIVQTLISLTIFTFDWMKHKEKNWYCFFVIALSYLPDLIFMTGSFYYVRHS